MTGLLILLLTGLALILLCPPGQGSGKSAAEDPERATVDAIDRLLPQTQCRECHYPGCRPYARALAREQAPINLCPPGGETTVRALARLLGRDPEPLPARHGGFEPGYTAVIDEDLCIGCVKCIRACPVDAIIGAPGVMHTVIKPYCTGCRLCIDPCPVDCISLKPVRVKTREWVWSKPDPAARLQT